MIAVAYIITSFFAGIGIFEKDFCNCDYIPLSLEEISRVSDAIVIGRVGDLYIDVEYELTGDYNIDRILLVRAKSTVLESDPEIRGGERVLLFMDITSPDGRWGYPIAGVQSKFSIDENNVAYNPIYGSYKLDDLVEIVKRARSD